MSNDTDGLPPHICRMCFHNVAHQTECKEKECHPRICTEHRQRGLQMEMMRDVIAEGNYSADQGKMMNAWFDEKGKTL